MSWAEIAFSSSSDPLQIEKGGGWTSAVLADIGFCETLFFPDKLGLAPSFGTNRKENSLKNEGFVTNIGRVQICFCTSCTHCSYTLDFRLSPNKHGHHLVRYNSYGTMFVVGLLFA